ncbi:MAG: serine hydroxymethyltransferase [Planctomycetota bacterium]
MSKKNGFTFDAKLSSLDPDIVSFIKGEEERQSNNLLMIASESLCPMPVREALTAVFTNKYAEGYPSLRMTIGERNRIEKEPERYLAFHRRYGDRRFYKGAEFSNFVEVLAQRRVAELFANPNAPVDDIFVNVQPLSGAAANNAVYNSFLVPGDVMMGLSLSYGGHLTHGSPFNRSGRQYKVIPYTVDPRTGQFDYELLEKLALEHKPNIIISGASAYPWNIDWQRLKAICEKVPVQVTGLNRSGAVLMADISHPAGLVVAGLFNNPVGVADVTTFTTHKTLCGPRGAVIISTDEDIAKRIDLGVFPGEQGGPHLNNIAAKAVAFKIAASKEFKQLQKKIAENCLTLAEEFKKLGYRLAYGGTNTHLVLIDLDSVKTASGIPSKGDVASNILDLCGITCNKNALPGDETGARPRGLRFGTTVLSQLGMGAPEMKKIARLVHYVLSNIKTFTVMSHSGEIVRGKIDLEVMEKTRAEVDKLLGLKGRAAAKGNAIEIVGERAIAFLQSLVSDNLYLLKPGQAIQTTFKVGKDNIAVAFKMVQPDVYLIAPNKAKLDTFFRYFNGLSDGYITWREDDVYAKVEGPVVISRVAYSVGRIANTLNMATQSAKPKADFIFKPYTGEPRKTSLYDEHLKLTKAQFLVPFAGWSMPLWYTRASEEHQAVRAAAGLFDVSHMGKLEISGPYATRFLDMVTTNYVPKLQIGQSHYSYVLDADGEPLDDILLYKMQEEKYLMVVNASNKEKIEQWLNAVNDGQVIIDRDNPNRALEGRVNIVDLGMISATGEGVLVNIALQGPNSLRILLKLADQESVKILKRIKKTCFAWVTLGGIKALPARTGYTGEEIAYEIFVAKEDAARFWRQLLETGKEFGLKPCGLAARDSLRTEAGLPLYGHELNGDNKVMPTEAGYGAFIKRHKPFFIGRKAYIQKEKQSTVPEGIRDGKGSGIVGPRRVVRFRITTPNARAIKPGDAVFQSASGPVSQSTSQTGGQSDSQTGRPIGLVTSCTLATGGQIGLALIDKKFAIEGGNLQVIPTPRPGSQQVAQPADAIILSRFIVKG